MKRLLYFFVLVVLYSCVSSRLFGEYNLYQRDSSISYPTEKLTLKFNDEFSGEFINVYNTLDTFAQHFNFIRVNNDYLIVKQIEPKNDNLISLKQGDTIVMVKNRLHFFYRGDKKYLLSFRK